MNDPLQRAEELYRQWRLAMTRRDVDWFERVEHDRFTYTGSDGSRKSKADHIRMVTSAREAEFRTTIRTAEQFGDTLIVTGDHWARSVVDAGQAGMSPELVRKMARGITYAFTSVWLTVDKEAYLLAHQTSEHTATTEPIAGGEAPRER